MFLDEIFQQVETVPDRCAVKNQSGEISYQELGRMIAWFSALFAKKKLDISRPVIIYAHKALWIPAAYLALARMGVAYLPVDIGTPEKRLCQIIRESDAQLIIGENIPDGCGIAAMTIDPNLRRLSEKPCVSPGEYTPSPDTVLYIIFTSGSSGKPKGIPITHGNLQAFLDWIWTLPGFHRADDMNYSGKAPVILNQASFSFDLSVTELYDALCTGKTLFLLTRKTQTNFPALFQALGESAAQIAVFTPSFARYLMRDQSFNQALLPRLHTVFFCGEALPGKLVKKLRARFPALRILNAYGPTETTVAVCAYEVPPAWDSAEVPISSDMQSSVLFVVDDAGEPCPAGTTGEILVYGDSVSPGYLDGAMGGFTSFRGKPAYRTGDAGVVRDGLLYCLGRRDRQIKHSGYRIEPLEIELCLMQQPYVSHAAVLAAGGRLAAVIETGSVAISPDDQRRIKEELQKMLPAYMVPDRFICVEQMPVTTNGKCDYTKLGEMVNR